MNTIAVNRTVGELVREQPNRARVFESLGIDYCCGGKKTLEDVCAGKGLNAEEVMARLQALDSEGSESTEVDVDAMPLDALANHIVATHHAYLKRELPRLNEMVQKVNRVHGDKDSRLADLERTLYTFTRELDMHMMKEEQVLFPAITTLAHSDAAPNFMFGSVAHPIQMMESEHDSAGDGLEQMRKLTDDFTPPDWACNTYRAMLDGLVRLEADMHQHIHKENNVLFPKAIELEAKLNQGQ